VGVTTVHVAERTELDVPAGYAFDFLADPSTATVIDPAIREYRPDTLPMRSGTRNVIRMRMWGLPVRAVSVVKEWEPGARMVMENERPSWPVRVVATHRFEPAGTDRCAYTWAIDLHPVGPLGRVAARLLGRFLRANAAAQQVRLKAEVERRWRSRAEAGPPGDTEAGPPGDTDAAAPGDTEAGPLGDADPDADAGPGDADAGPGDADRQ
jgi:hypothetical protein